MSSPDSLARLQAALDGRYTVEREVGAGGMATVYLATDLRHQRRVALKVLRPDLAASVGAERFLQEVRVTANLQHPHILPLFDSGEADGFLYFVMPFVEGESLRERLVREGELPVPEVARLLRDVVEALAAAHARGVVHRDIKPENVMLSGGHAMVADFGVAKAVSEATGRHHLTTKGVALGTPAYMAPEQASGEPHVDHRADIYAVGVVGYELLAGRPPFGGRTVQQVLAAQVMEAPRPVREHRPSVPPALEALLMRCLEKKAADRWQSAEEMLPHLEALASSSGGMTPTDVPPLTAPARKRADMLPWMSAVALMAALASAAVWWAARGRSADDAPAMVAEADSEPARLMVMPLDNLTGDSAANVWAQLAAEWMGRAIDQPKAVAVVPASSVRDAIRALGDSASVTTVGRRLKASHGVAGTMARTGASVRFEVELLDLRTGERLRSLEPIVGPVDSVEAVAGRLAQAAAAAAVALLDPSAPPVMAATSSPPSVEVYRRYLDQGQLFCEGRIRDVIAAGDRTLALAPNFVPALLWNAVAYSFAGRAAEADSTLRDMLPLRSSMTTWERLMADFIDAGLRGDALASVSVAEEGLRLDPSLWSYPAGYAALQSNHLERAVELISMAVDLSRLCSGASGHLASLATAYHLLGRYDEELGLARRGRSRFPGHSAFLFIEARALAGLGRVSAVDSLLDVASRLDATVGLSTVWTGLELRAHGHPEAAAATMDRALAFYAALPPDSARYDRGTAFFQAGHFRDADTLFAALRSADPTSTNVDLPGMHGVTLARLGRTEDARRVDSLLAVWDAPGTLGGAFENRAEIAAVLGDRDGAVRLMREAFAHGLGYDIWWHLQTPFETLKGYGPWEQLFAPRE